MNMKLKPKVAEKAVQGMLQTAHAYDRRATWKLAVGWGNEPDGFYTTLLKYEPEKAPGCREPACQSMLIAGPFSSAKKALLWSHGFDIDVWVDAEELAGNF